MLAAAASLRVMFSVGLLLAGLAITQGQGGPASDRGALLLGVVFVPGRDLGWTNGTDVFRWPRSLATTAASWGWICMQLLAI